MDETLRAREVAEDAKVGSPRYFIEASINGCTSGKRIRKLKRQTVARADGSSLLATSFSRVLTQMRKFQPACLDPHIVPNRLPFQVVQLFIPPALDVVRLKTNAS